MRFTKLVPLVVAAALILGGSAHALPIFSATLANNGAYDVTWDESYGNFVYTYRWEVTFNGIDTIKATTDPLRMSGFALYEMPATLLVNDNTLAATEAPTTILEADGDTRAVNWSDATLIQRSDTGGYDVYWPSKNPGPNLNGPVYAGETIGYFVTRFSEPGLSDDYLADIPSAIHVQWDEQSEWINNTPEPASAILLALGLPAALAMRRRRGQSSDEA